MRILSSQIRWGGVCLTLVAAGCTGCLERSRAGEAGGPPPSGPSAGPGPEERSEASKDERPKKIRKAAVAGAFYEEDRAGLAKSVDEFLAKGEGVKLPGQVIALVSPHAGYRFSGKAAAAGYRLLKGRDLRRVVVLGVTHHVPFQGASIADVTHYETPLGLIPVDTEAVARLRRSKVVHTVPEADAREHSLEVQLPLLQRVLPRFSLVPLILGGLSEEDTVELARALSEIVDRRTLVVASSDFTHRGPSYSYEVPEGKGPVKERLARIDQESADRILALDRKGLFAHVAKTGTTICGLRPIGVLLELLAKQKGVKGQVVSHYTSGDVLDDWTSTVSYFDIAFTGAWPERSALDEARTSGESLFPVSTEEKRVLLGLARKTLDASVRKGSFDPGPLREVKVTDSLRRKAGAFVTLNCKHGLTSSKCASKGHDLRGCIGTIAPEHPVLDVVARRAASAALEDPRFPNVTVEELPFITVEVSILTPPRPVKGPEEIVVGRHGILLSKGGAGATFLPQVAPEQGWDRETTLNHLAAKAGLPSDGWRSGASFQVYEAIVFSEGTKPAR